MASILHFRNDKECKEYVVITENDSDDEAEEFREEGYILSEQIVIDDIGSLPNDRPLRPD